MANVSNPTPRTYETDVQFNDYPQAAEKTYEGSALSNAIVSNATSGNVHTLVAAEDFMGFAATTQDNSAGTAGGVNLTVNTAGSAVLPVAGLAATSLDATVYASDGNTFTLTSSGNTKIGTVARIENLTATLALVKFDGKQMRSQAV